MANQKTSLYKVLVALVFLCWFQSSGRVEAAELTNYVWNEDYKYYSSGINNSLSYHRITNYTYETPDPRKLKKLIYTGADGNMYFITWSYELIDVYQNYTQYYVRTNGSTYDRYESSENYTGGNYRSTFLLNNGQRVYIYGYGGVEKNTNTNNQTSELTMYADFYDRKVSISNPDVVLKNILNEQITPDIPYFGDYTPDWSDSEYDQLLKIENLHASIEDGILYMTWDPVIYPSGDREFHYIKFNFKQRHPGTVEGSNRRNYVEKQFYIKYKNLCGQIPIADLELDEGYILSSMQADPYYHLSDNPEYPLKRGDTTYIYFDDEGNSTNPIIIDPAIDPDVEEEAVPRTILGSIQNFFGNYYRKLLDTSKNAVVPESDDFLGLLNDMNDWFSERFGFIWYPFDLAVDIVGAFALGEPDTKITVPALTLNMMGGIQLWDSFVIDLDPVDFLKYVRFFTSVLMCCGTVSLAIKKWDEWIGGKNQ